LYIRGKLSCVVAGARAIIRSYGLGGWLLGIHWSIAISAVIIARIVRIVGIEWRSKEEPSGKEKGREASKASMKEKVIVETEWESMKCHKIVGEDRTSEAGNTHSCRVHSK
jgi:hypothetical protein